MARALIAGSSVALIEGDPADAAAPTAIVLPMKWHGGPALEGACSNYLSFWSLNEGAVAYVRKCRNSNGTTIRANGSVKDMDNNGACGIVQIKYNGYAGTDTFGWACPKGDEDLFTGYYRSGTNIDVYVLDVLV